MAAPADGPVGIIAGGGGVPLVVARAAEAAGQGAVLFAIAGEADPSVEEHRHHWLRWGEIGRLFDLLKREQVRDVVIAGSISRRPDYGAIRLDLGAVLSLPRILSIVVGGDDSVLSGVVRFIEGRGFRVRGAHEIAPDLAAPVGALTRLRPSSKAVRDIDAAYEAALALGRLDIGQAAVAVGGRVVGVEGAEGTDGLVARIGGLRTSGRLVWKGREGVLVKAAKPQQDLRIDMPTIGPATADAVAGAGLAGIAVEGGRVMIVEREETLARLDRDGLFLVGLERGSPG